MQEAKWLMYHNSGTNNVTRRLIAIYVFYRLHYNILYIKKSGYEGAAGMNADAEKTSIHKL